MGLCRWIVISTCTVATRLALFPISVVQLKKIKLLGKLLPKCEFSHPTVVNLNFYPRKVISPFSSSCRTVMDFLFGFTYAISSLYTKNENTWILCVMVFMFL